MRTNVDRNGRGFKSSSRVLKRLLNTDPVIVKIVFIVVVVVAD